MIRITQAYDAGQVFDYLGSAAGEQVIMDAVRRRPGGPWRQWNGETVVVMASGPSLCAEDVDYVRGKARVLVINTTFRAAPWADALYSNDHDWYAMHLPQIRETFRGQLWCGHPTWRAEGVRSIPFDRAAPGLRTHPNVIAWGMNSGGAALNLAYQFVGDAGRIVMLGYDQGWTGGQPRWHGRHPAGLQNQKPGFHRWARWFEQAAEDFRGLGVEVVNCSRATTLTCFERRPLRDVL